MSRPIQLKQTDHSSLGSLPHHTKVHSHQSPLQEIFGRAQHTLPPSTNRNMIQCHPTEITTTNQEL
jgi:hypothetical protein